MMTHEQAHTLAQRWIAAWNAHDIEAVLALFADSFSFSSPLIYQLTGLPSSKLEGKQAVRAYWQRGLAHLPNLHFELVEVLIGTDSLTILYRGHRGLSAEVLTLGDDGLVLRGQAFYST